MMPSLDILMVEDNDGDIELMKIAFEDGNLRSRLAVVHNGAEALDYLKRRGHFAEAVRPDLILLDVNMPRMNGAEFLKAAKTDDGIKTIPVIMFTSSDAETDVRQCYALHANAYIIKPQGLEKFAAVAEQLETYWGGQVRLPSRAAARPS